MSLVALIVAVTGWALGLLWLVIGVIAVVGRLPRNRRFGVRTDETMRSDEAFALANRVAAPGQIAASVILLLGGLLSVGIDSAWSVLFGLVGILAAVFLVGLVSAAGIRAAAALPADDEAGCGCCSGDAEHDHTPAAASADAGADQTAVGSGPATDCGTSSCGACSLRGVCTPESAQA